MRIRLFLFTPSRKMGLNMQSTERREAKGMEVNGKKN
jgi:hypothetical protein